MNLIYSREHFIYFFKILFPYLFLAVLDLRCCAGFSFIVSSRGYSLVMVHGLLIAVASLVVNHGLKSLWASVDVAPGP